MMHQTSWIIAVLVMCICDQVYPFSQYAFRIETLQSLRQRKYGHDGAVGSTTTIFQHAKSSKMSTPTLTSLQLSSQTPAEFEMQELRAQLAGMRKAGISSADLTEEKRLEIENYVRSVATYRNSPIDLSTLAVGDTMVGIWRLAFSTEAAALGVLPKEARVLVKIYDSNGRGKMDYTLKFTKKVFALRSLTARSYFEISSGPPNPGLVSYQYQEISSDLFGVNIPTGLFGLLKGRVNYIESVYFDGTFWIDRGFSPDGKEYYNVFFREEDTDEDI